MDEQIQKLKEAITKRLEEYFGETIFLKKVTSYNRFDLHLQVSPKGKVFIKEFYQDPLHHEKEDEFLMQLFQDVLQETGHCLFQVGYHKVDYDFDNDRHQRISFMASDIYIFIDVERIDTRPLCELVI